MDACSTGGCEMIQLLLDNGADTIAKDDSVSVVDLCFWNVIYQKGFLASTDQVCKFL